MADRPLNEAAGSCFWDMVRYEARIGLRGAPMAVAAVASAVVGWTVGNAAGRGAGLSALSAGDAACTYLSLGAVYWLSMVAARDSATSATAIILSKPQPTERLVLGRFLGGYLQVLILLAALFAGAVLSRLYHSGTLAGWWAYGFEIVRAALVVFFASAFAYSLSTLTGTPLAGALAGMYWLVTMAGQEYLAKIYFPYYTQNLPAYTSAGIFLITFTALVHLRGRRGSAKPEVWCRVLLALALAGTMLAVWHTVRTGHDPLMRTSPLMEEMSRQDAVLLERSPGFRLPDQRGRLVSLSDTPGRIFVIALLDPHSEEGVLLLDRLRALYRRYGRRGVLPVAVCIANDQGAARTVAAGEDAAFPVLVDWGSHHAPRWADRSPVASAFRVTDLPYVAVTDRRRRIRAILEGISTYDGPMLEAEVRARLSEEPR